MNIKITLVTILFGFLFTNCTNAQTKSAENQMSKEPPKKESSVKPTELNKEEFLKKVYNFEANPDKWKYEGDKPCVVDFYATWCGPCKALAPIMDELSEEYAGQVYFYKIDVDKANDVAGVFGVQSIPTLLFIPVNGEPSVTKGVMPKSQLKEIIQQALFNKK